MCVSSSRDKQISAKSRKEKKKLHKSYKLIFMSLSETNIRSTTTQSQHSVVVVNTVASQQQGPYFDSTICPVWSLHIFPVFVWVLCVWTCSYSPRPKWWFQVAHRCKCANVNGCLSLIGPLTGPRPPTTLTRISRRECMDGWTAQS